MQDIHTLERRNHTFIIAAKEDFFYEIKEIKRKVSQFGHMAQSWSAYESEQIQKSLPRLEDETVFNFILKTLEMVY